MKKFFYSMCILCTIIISFGMTSCKNENKNEDSLTFSFIFSCNEELLDFVIPTAIYLDENGDKQEVVLTKSSFNEVTTQADSIIYEWKKDIKLINTHTGQRDMQVSYKMRKEAPHIDSEKMYYMYRSLSCTYTQIYEHRDIIINANNSIKSNISISEIKGDKLQAYLEKLENTPDYIKEEVK